MRKNGYLSIFIYLHKMGDIQKDYRHDYKTAKYYYETGYKNDKDLNVVTD